LFVALGPQTYHTYVGLNVSAAGRTCSAAAWLRRTTPGE